MAPPSYAPKPPKGQGQWAFGHLEPLNANERIKKDDDGLNVRRRIETIYAHRGFASIDPADLRGRMRWWGLYTQRRPASTAARPRPWSRTSWTTSTSCCASASTAAQLTPSSCASIAEISTEFARGTADITDRQNIQLHWIRIEDVPEIWRRLEDVGPDHHRGLRRHPARHPRLPGRRHRRRRDHRRHPGDRGDHRSATSATRRSPTCRASSRPRSAARPHQDVAHEINDIAFVGVVHPEHGPASTCGSAAACPPTRSSRVAARRLGHAATRSPRSGPASSASSATTATAGCAHRARLKFLVADWGAEKFREVLEDEYLGGR